MRVISQRKPLRNIQDPRLPARPLRRPGEKRRLRRGRLVLHEPRSLPPLPEPRPGPERVKLPTREMPARPFATLASLLSEMQRRTGHDEQPSTPEVWR